MRLKDQVAIITGGANGIGRATALTYVNNGAIAVICDVNEQLGQETLKELQAINPKCMFFKVDVTNREEIQNMVNGVVAQLGKIDILVNNAGITQDSMLKKMTEAQFDLVIKINLKGVFNCTQIVAEVMTSQLKGKIINASSVVGIYGNIGQTNYIASKAGVIGMTKGWAKELGRKGISVNCVAPGFIQTDMTAAVPDKVLDMMKEKSPLGRLGVAQDIANAYLFLASSEADFITGITLSVDGGLVI